MAFLAQSFDPTVIARLRAVLVETCPQDDATGRALVGLATVLDARATAVEAQAVCLEALARLHPESDPRLRAICLLGVARWPNQKRDIEQAELRDAIANAVEARDLAERARDQVLAARCTAMEGLLVKRTARFVTGQARVERLTTAHRLIEKARLVREDIYADDDLNLDLAKARFNMGGVGIELAKACPDERELYLGQAEWGYRKALAARLAAYGSMSHRHVASCQSGIGMVSYYRAVLGGPYGDCTSVALRDATRLLVDALDARERLEPRDDNDATKTLHLLAKTVLMRLAANEVEHGTAAGVGPRPAQTLADYERELTMARLDATPADVGEDQTA